VPAVGLGCSYLLAIVLLGPLLGSSADASTAFTDHFADEGNRLRDLVGSFALLVAAGSLVWTVVAARTETATLIGSPLRDLTVPRWIVVTALATAVTLALGVTVVLLVRFGAWAIAVGLVWTGGAPT